MGTALRDDPQRRDPTVDGPTGEMRELGAVALLDQDLR
jgi:hypothetical protein